MKTRHGLVSNSSSSSFIVIDARAGHTFPPYTTLTVDGNLGETEFGWGPDECHGFGSRVIFAYLQTLYMRDNNPDLANHWFNLLEACVRKHTGAAHIFWNVSREYREEGMTWGYIDHQSNAAEQANMEMFDSEDALRDFLFGAGSKIVLDNDNRDDYD